MNNEYTIRTREELILALQEAAHVEHGLLLQYLYAAFSMKQTEAEGLQWDEMELVNAWKGDLLRIARDEMGHLGTVMNMMIAVGAYPLMQRPPFPQRTTKWFPVPFELTGFSLETVNRFVRFESPEPLHLTEFAAVAPVIPRYTYVGELYRAIRAGFLTVDSANPNLFLGRPGAEDKDTWGLHFAPRPILSVADATMAIDALVSQGEGAPDGSNPSAHFTTFSRIASELSQAIQKNPGFSAGRDVVNNPTLRPLGDPNPAAFVIDSALPSFELGAIHSSLYILLLQILQAYYDPVPQESALRGDLQTICAQLMMLAVRPIGEILTTLPASSQSQSPRSGPSFELYGDIALSPDPLSRWTLMHERLQLAIEAATNLAARDIPELPPLENILLGLKAINEKIDGIKGAMHA